MTGTMGKKTDRRAEAAAWFAVLRDRICGEFETIETEFGSRLRFYRNASVRDSYSSGPGCWR